MLRYYYTSVVVTSDFRFRIMAPRFRNSLGPTPTGFFSPGLSGEAYFLVPKKRKKNPSPAHITHVRGSIENWTHDSGRAAGHATGFLLSKSNGFFFFPPAFCLTILLYNPTQKTIWLPYVRHTTISLQCTAAGRTFSTNNRSTVMISGVRFLRRLFRPLKSSVHDARPGGGGPPSLLYDSFVPVISHKRQHIIT